MRLVDKGLVVEDLVERDRSPPILFFDSAIDRKAVEGPNHLQRWGASGLHADSTSVARGQIVDLP